MNILGALKKRELGRQQQVSANPAHARKALTNATVNELSNLVTACIEDVGILSRHVVDRGDINKSVLTIVSAEPYVLKTDKLLESMESQLIQTSKALDDGHGSARLIAQLKGQLSSTIERITKADAIKQQHGGVSDSQGATHDSYKML
mmetsp:Transcript_6792/g.8574  ORF Transcript_6792/g.8574 Transcript_6792/m.8574 type:complete len:148 (+) Transcript_6792:378-821(+)